MDIKLIKKCSVCNKEKLDSEFYEKTKGCGIRRAVCKECEKKKIKSKYTYIKSSNNIDNKNEKKYKLDRDRIEIIYELYRK